MKPTPRNDTPPNLHDRPTRYLTVPVAHFGLATSKPFRRSFLRELRKVVRALPPDVGLDLHIQCREGGACCRRQSIEMTIACISAAIEDWTGLHPFAIVREPTS